jgi:hypothetical protein
VKDGVGLGREDHKKENIKLSEKQLIIKIQLKHKKEETFLQPPPYDEFDNNLKNPHPLMFNYCVFVFCIISTQTNLRLSF